jgi:hypothetical protein
MAIDRACFALNVIILHNEGVFQLKGGVGTIILTPNYYIIFKCPTPNVVQSNHGESWMDQRQSRTMLIPNLDMNGWVK